MSRTASLGTAFTLATGFALTLCAASPANAQMGFDERTVVASPTYFPWYTATKVKIGPEGNGRGSAVLAADCTLLTAGHVVYSANNGTWRTLPAVQPGHYYDEGLNSGVDPFGSRVPSGLATNTKWTGGQGSDYDYGAIFIPTSFRSSGITTHIPVAFDLTPGIVNSAGYPSEDVPSAATGATQEQWFAHGATSLFTTRRMYYEATSTGGASGAGVWVLYNSGERYLVGVNTAHNDTYDGIGTRFVSQNETVVNGWLNRGCSGEAARASLSWDTLKGTLRLLDGSALALKPLASLNLVNPPAKVSGKPGRRVSQWIEGTFYRWEEFWPNGGADTQSTENPEDNFAGGAGRPPQRYLRMVSPRTQILSTADARILLSASLSWQGRALPALAARQLAPEPANVWSVTQGDVRQDTVPAQANAADAEIAVAR